MEQQPPSTNEDDRLQQIIRVGQILADALTELRTGNNGEYEPLSLPADAYHALDKWSELTANDYPSHS